MTILLLTANPKTKETEAIEAKVKIIVPDVRTIAKVDEIATESKGHSEERTIIIVVVPDLAASQIDTFVKIAEQHQKSIFFILISNEISALDYKRLIRSGTADWVAANSSLQEIPDIIQRIPETFNSKQIPARTRIKPTIASFLPSMGGVGNTTIALEVALRIKLAKASRAWKICIVDLDFQTSHVCDYLDIDARLQIRDLIEHPERLDHQLFELFLSHHQCGLDVIAAPRNKLDPCEIKVSALDALFAMILENYEFIVLAMPVTWFNWAAPTLKNSDAIIVTGINTIPCLRQMRSTLDAILDAKAPSSQMAVVINRAARKLFGRIDRRQHVETVLAEKNLFFVREDPHSVGRVNTGIPAALGDSGGYAKDLAKIGSFCTAIRQEALAKVAG